MAIYAALPTKFSSKKASLSGSSKSGSRTSRPVVVTTLPVASLVIAASKPRNPLAADTLLKKSGPHDDKRRAQKIRGQDQLQSGLDEVQKRNAED